MVKADRSYAERWAPKAVEECCELWDLTEEKGMKLLLLKEKVADLHEHWKNDPFELIRFLIEFKFDLKTAEKKFRHSIQWRLEHNADQILEEYTPPALYNYFPLGVLAGADRDGDPVYIERSGAADTLGLLQRFGKEEMIKQAIWGKELMSRGPWQKHWPHGRVKHFVTILDLKGLNRHHLHPALVPVGQAVTRLVQDNYPGIGKRILVINAPFFFRFVWNVFKHFVDPNVKELLEIATEGESRDLLHKYMELSILPKEMIPEGRGRTVQGYEPIWHGGPLPPPSKDDRRRGTSVFPSAPAPAAPAERLQVSCPAGPKPETPTTTTTTMTTTSSNDSMIVFTFDKPRKSTTVITTATTTTSPTASHLKTPTIARTPLQQLQTTPSVSTDGTGRKSWESLPSITQSSSRSSSHHNNFQTPLHQPNRTTPMDGGSTMHRSCASWESLPQVTPLRRNIQQAWTVTPGPYYYNLQEVWNQSNFDGMAQLWDLSEVDQARMHKLKDSILDVHHWKNDPYEVIRFYHEYDGNLDKIEHQFRKMIVWRVENDMDDFLSNYGQPDPLFLYMPICVLKGLDKEGDPIYIDRMGSCDYYSLLKHFGADGMINYITFLRELNSSQQFWQQPPNLYEEVVGHRVKSFTVIIDLDGLSGKHFRPALLSLLKKTTKLSQENYAGWAKRILVIRAPPLFKLLYWSIVKKFFAPHVRALIEFSPHGDSYMSLLDKYMDRDVLPSVIYSESQGKVMPGYYENVKLEGGPIPKGAFQKSSSSTTSSTGNNIPAAGAWASQSVPLFSSTSSPPAKTIALSRRRHSVPMPPTNEDDDDDDDVDDSAHSWSPSTPVTTTHLLLGHWEGELKQHSNNLSSSKKKELHQEGKKAAERNDASIRAAAAAKKASPNNNVPWQSPMFKYNW